MSSQLNDAPAAKEQELFTVQEVAKRLRVDDTTVRRWIKSGALDAIRLPSKGRACYRVKRNTFDQLLALPEE